MRGKKFLRASYYAAPLAFLPVVAQAANPGLSDVIKTIIDLINKSLIPLAIAVALLWFLWGLVKYITAGGEETKQTEGRQMMVNGVIVLFVMVAVWGLVNVLIATLFSNGWDPLMPRLPRL